MHNSDLFNDLGTEPPLCFSWDQVFVDPARYQGSVPSNPNFESFYAPSLQSSPEPPPQPGTPNTELDQGSTFLHEFETRLPEASTPVVTQAFLSNVYERQLPALFAGIAHDTNAIEALTELIAEIREGRWPENPRAGILVTVNGEIGYCRAAGCQEHPTGLAYRNMWAHVWIHHLGRRFLCPADGCRKPLLFRKHDLGRHFKGAHEGKRGVFPCAACGRKCTTRYNLNRHSKRVHPLPITSPSGFPLAD